MSAKSISSAANPIFKELQALVRGKNSLGDSFLLEGKQYIEIAQRENYVLDFLVAPSHENLNSLAQESPPARKNLVLESHLFEKLCFKNQSGLLGVFKKPGTQATPSTFPSNAKVLVLDGLEKPGNIGAIFRSAFGLGADYILLHNIKSSCFNPSAIINSKGAALSKKIFTVENSDAIAEIAKASSLPIYGLSQNEKSESLNNATAAPSFLIVGNEANGISKHVLALCDKVLEIPMHTELVDSYNASVAAALAMYKLWQ